MKLNNLFNTLFGVLLFAGSNLAAPSLVSMVEKSLYPNVHNVGNLTKRDSVGTRGKFWGANYSPYTQSGCRSSNEIKEDLKLINSVADNVRVFGMNDCGVAPILLETAQELGMKVVYCLWVPNSFEDEINTLTSLMNAPGFQETVIAIGVGNEMLFNAQIDVDGLISLIVRVRGLLTNAGINVPVTTSEPLGNWTPELVNKVDILFPTIYPFFGQLELTNSLEKTWDWVDGVVGKLGAHGKDMIVSEIGWPSLGASNGAAVPSLANKQRFLRDLVCFAKSRGIRYFVFEAFDAAWKSNDWDKSFGIFTQERTPEVDLSNLGC